MPEDHQLIASVLNDDPYAQRRFVEEYTRVFTSAFRRMMSHRDDLVADLVQEVFESLFANDYRKLRAWRGESSLRCYLLKVASNVAMDRLRSRQYRPIGVTDNTDQAGDPLNPAENSPLTTMLANEIRGAVDHCLRQLRARDRELLSRRHLRDENPQLIAEFMGLTANSVSAGVTRAAERMKRCINTQFPGLFRLEPFEPHDTF